jgi:hypothetical protein
MQQSSIILHMLKHVQSSIQTASICLILEHRFINCVVYNDKLCIILYCLMMSSFPLIFLWHEVSGWNNWHNSHGPFWESINAWKSKLQCGMWLQTSLWTFQLYGTGDYGSLISLQSTPFLSSHSFSSNSYEINIIQVLKGHIALGNACFPNGTNGNFIFYLCRLFVFMCTTGKPCYSETSSYIDFTHPLIYCIL